MRLYKAAGRFGCGDMEPFWRMISVLVATLDPPFHLIITLHVIGVKVLIAA